MGCIDKKISELTPLAVPAINDLLVIVDVSVAGFETKNITVADLVTGGIVAPADPQYVTMAVHAGLPNERVLTGTANQVIVTDGGAGGNVTLSTPQDIHIAAVPQFAGLGLGGAGVVDQIVFANEGTITTSIGDLILQSASTQVYLPAGNTFGIGTPNPGALIELYSDVNSNFIMGFGDGLSPLARFLSYSGGNVASTISAQMRFEKSEGTLAIPIICKVGDRLGKFDWTGYDGIDTATVAASMVAVVDGAVGANIVPGRLEFELLSAAGGARNEVLRLTAYEVNINPNGDNDIDLRVEGDTEPYLLFVESTNERIGINASTINAKLHIDQSNNAAAIPALLLDQADIDQVLMKIIGTAEAASADRTLVADSDFGTPGALIGWIQIEVQDDGNRILDADYWIPFHAIPT